MADFVIRQYARLHCITIFSVSNPNYNLQAFRVESAAFGIIQKKNSNQVAQIYSLLELTSKEVLR